jgi:DNA-binding CsgD family transcriptional regulator
MGIIARVIGLTGDDPIPPDVAALLIERQSALSRCEARMVVLDLLGVRREDLSDELGLSTESIHTYWKRIYRKSGQRGRAAVRIWAQALLAKEIGGTG